MTFLVHVYGQAYAVTNAEVGGVEAVILEAVRAGGAFVDFTGAGGRPTRALIGPASWVRIEELPEQAEPPGEDGDFPDLSFVDLE